MKCKVLTSSRYEAENDINEWLQTGKYEIISINQINNESYIVTTFLYLDTKEVRQKKLIKLKNL